MQTSWNLVATYVLVVTVGIAQDSQRTFVTRGQISSDTAISGSLTAELSKIGEAQPERAWVNPDGSFEFLNLRPGLHQLRVINSGGAILTEEMVVIGPSSQPLTIHISDPVAAGRPAGNAVRYAAGNTVSVRQLSHKIPPQAQKAYDKGRHAAAKGDVSQAKEFFRQAVTIDPEFAEAFNELGAGEAALGDLTSAAEEFQKALDLVPNHPLALHNLAIMLVRLNRFHEAAEVARRALKILPGSGRMRYLLAACLLVEHGDTDEVLESLERAVNEVPKAHIAAADLLVERGRTEDAIRHLEQYLHSVPADDKDRDRVSARLAELKR